MPKILTFLFCFVWAVSPAYAGLTDPVPIYPNVSLEKSTHFFCPQTKNFYKDSDKIAAETILLEALGEGYRGMVAVGEVIRNRQRLFRKDADQICRMPKQFSCWNDPERAQKFLKKYRVYYFVALLAWKHSKHTSLTSGATDYHANSIHPYWADAYRVAARVGRHIFYSRVV